ncbi:MAG: FKBP-type peptidyl-prolyl cis-trans isomerase [Flavobacteriaceae bacterium]
MKIFAVVSLLFLFVSCGSDTPSNPTPIDYTAQNEKEITDYLLANDLVAQKTASGLHYIIENQGDGAQPTASSNVTVAYKGYFLNGTVFDESDEAGLSIGLNQVIPGWTQGIALFNEGGNGLLFVPAHLAYGSFDYNGIPGGSVLIFEVNLISVN